MTGGRRWAAVEPFRPVLGSVVVAQRAQYRGSFGVDDVGALGRSLIGPQPGADPRSDLVERDAGLAPQPGGAHRRLVGARELRGLGGAQAEFLPGDRVGGLDARARPLGGFVVEPAPDM